MNEFLFLESQISTLRQGLKAKPQRSQERKSQVKRVALNKTENLILSDPKKERTCVDAGAGRKSIAQTFIKKKQKTKKIKTK